MENVGTTIANVVLNALDKLVSYLPQFLGGLLVLLVGLLVATLLRSGVAKFFELIRLDQWFSNVSRWFAQEDKALKDAGKKVWPDLLAELVRWTVVILFLIPAVEAWGLPKITEVLNQFLLYIPNVFVAVVVGFVGFGVAGLVHDIVRHASRNLGSDSANLLATVARYALVFFTALVVLNQLGVASDLIRILFTGIVAMLAIAGGLAFGLGGQGVAKNALEDLRKRVEK
ncbi:hypothetical protein HYW42_04880 [Candidatus Daviesbacteria bacterium]|nr:hypothetical protein [Candidatus Daviesbacteria bacterium]